MTTDELNVVHLFYTLPANNSYHVLSTIQLMYITAFLTIFISFFAITYASHNAQEPLHHHSSVTTMSKSLNVFKQPLALHSTQPMTGFLRNGYCEVPASDFGNHAIAAEVTEEFLDYSAKQGNDLRPIPGMKGGCKWCLCVSR